MILIFVCSFSFALNWTGSQWTDNPVFMRSGYMIMSVLEVTGDASFDGDLYVQGTIDVSGDMIFDYVTISEDVTADGNIFIAGSLDVSEDLTANTATIAGATSLATMTVSSDATFDGTVTLSENTIFSMAADEYFRLDAATAAMTQTAGALDINLVNGATGTSAININLEAEDTFAAMYGLYINIDDDTAGGQETIHGIYVTNPTGTAGVSRGITLANNLQDAIVIDLTADTQAIVIDAATVDHTETGGVLDIAFDTVTNGVSCINIDMGTTTGGSDSDDYSAVLIDLDDDATDATVDIIGVKVTSSDLTGATNSRVIGFYSSGLDCALQADNGYLRIGTGSTPGITLGDDDAFIEGTLEVDSGCKFDGTVDLSENVTFTMAADEYLKLDAATTPMTQTAGAIDINVINGATNVSAINIDLEAENTFANLYGIYINIDDDATNDEETITGIYIANSEGTESTTQGISFANTMDDDIVSVLASAGQFAVINASTASHTETGGVIDISFDTSTDGVSCINIDMVSGAGGSDGDDYSAIIIDLDDDTDATADIIGVKVTSSDLTGDTATRVIGFYSSGLDCALQADNGYIRVGTGSTPDVTPGDDDLFVEGTIEIDGAGRFDGALDINAGADITGDLTVNAITVSGDVSFDGTVSTNSLLIYQPSAAQVIDGTDDAILANATMVILNPDADYTTDVTPTIADGTIGQILYITCANGESNRVRLQDEDYLAGTNLELGDTSRDISGKDVLTLIFDGTDWIEVHYANN